MQQKHALNLMGMFVLLLKPVLARGSMLLIVINVAIESVRQFSQQLLKIRRLASIPAVILIFKTWVRHGAEKEYM